MKSILCNERCNKGYEWCNHSKIEKLLREENIPNIDAILKEMFDYENSIWEEQIEGRK